MWYRNPYFLLNGIFTSILLISGISCSRIEHTDTSSNQEQSQSDKPQHEDKPSKQKSLYITGLEFPKGHNWKPDVGTGSVEAKIFLMKDGERILEIPTGAIHETSIDSDMHKCFDGELYTIFNNGHESIVKRNGEETVRFPDTGIIYDFFAEKDKIHTLSKKGKGFVYCVNGNPVFECKNGLTYPGIYKDGKMTVFTYKEIKETGYNYNYGYIGDGSSYTLDVKGFREIESLVIDNKILHYLGVDQRKSFRWYVTNNHEIKIGDSDNGYIANTRLSLDVDGNAFIIGDCYYEIGTFPAIWNKDGNVTQENYDSRIALARANENRIYYVVKPEDPSEKITIKCGRYEIHSLPNHYDIICPANIDVNDDTCCIALHNSKDNKPVIWKDGITTEFDFNGFFTSVTYQ